LLTCEEVNKPNEAVPELYDRCKAFNVRGKGSQAVKTNFATHLYSALVARLGRHPRMVKSAEWVFGEKRCMQKFKINRKMDFEGGF
jgi:ectoine hydroxylase